MNVLADNNILIKYNRVLIMVIVLCLSQVAESAQPASKALLESFLNVNQTKAVVYFNENIENNQNILSCLESTSACQKSSVETELNNKSTELHFTQSSLLEFMQARHKEYRFMVGVAYFNALNTYISRGRASVTPMKGSGAVIFDIRSAVGKKEWQEISDFYNGEAQELKTHNLWLTEMNIKDEFVENKNILNFMKLQIASYIQKYPFLTKMQTLRSSKKYFITAIEEMISTYEDALGYVSNLEGDDRFEILGFVNIFEAALSSFSDKDQEKIMEHFQYLKDSDTFLSKLRGLFNFYTIGMIACYTSAIFAPPMLAVCGAIGVAFAIPGITKLVQNTIRMHKYLETGDYDEEVFGKYMLSNVISGIMYTVWSLGAIPGFVKNVRTVRAASISFVRKVRLRGKRIMTLNKKTLVEEVKIFWSYTKYYSKEFSLEAGGEQLAFFAGKSNSILPAMSKVFSATIKRVQASSPSIVKYSDMLKMTRQVVGGNLAY